MIETKNGKWQDFVDHCFDLFEKAKKSEYRNDKIESIKEAYRVYKQKEKPGSFPWQDASSIELPLFTITVDNIEPRIVAGLTGKTPFVNFDMDGLTEKTVEMEVVEDWFNQELDSTVNINDISSKVVHKALLEGEVFPIATYDEDEVTRRDFVYRDVMVPGPDGQPAPIKQIAIGEDGNPETEDKVESIFKGGRVEFAEYTDVFVPDNDKDWEKTDVIRIVRPTYGELMRSKGKLGFIDKNINSELLSEETDEKGEPSPEEEIDNRKNTGNEVIDCLECCIRYVFKEKETKKEDIKDWEEKRYIGLITKEGKVLLRITELINLNFKNEHLIKRVRLFPDGSSTYDKMRSIQKGSTDLFNMVVNVATICMIPWFLYTDTAGFEGEVKIKPGEGIKVDDVSQVAFPKFSQNPRSYMIFIEMFLQLWEKLGSIGDIQVGKIQEGSSDVTATETLAAIQEGNIKHNYQGLALKRDFITLLKTIYDLYYQKMPYDATFKYRGREVPVPRHSMRRRYNFRLTGSSDMSNRVIEMQKTEGLYKTVRQDPLANGKKLLEDIIKVYRPDANSEEYVNPMVNQLVEMVEQNPEIIQLIQQHIQGKQQQQSEQAQQQQVNMAQETGRTIAKEMVNPSA